MARFWTREIQGSELRDLSRELKKNGLGREVYKSVQRGDSLTNINKILKRANFDLDYSNVRKFLTDRYQYKTISTWNQKAVQNYGKRSGLLSTGTITAGHERKFKITVSGKNKAGEIIYRDVEVSVGQNADIDAHIEDVLDDIEEFGSDSLDFEDRPQVVRVRTSR